MGATWIRGAAANLLSRRLPEGAWSYRQGGSPSAEATAMAGLALLEAARGTGMAALGSAKPTASREAARWLARMQRPDGSVPAGAGVVMPGWTTTHAMLLWQRHEGFEAPLRKARAWLIRAKGWSPSVSLSDRQVTAHDMSLVGWPWTTGTSSWLEPTAMAVLALCDSGLRDHPRVADGVRLIQDRALPDGGWNYGNTAVFGKALRPQPGPTGIALCALAATGQNADASVAAAVAYLHRALAATRSAISVGWGVLGLTAVGARPPAADSWLEAALASSAGWPDSTLGTSLLLLAGGGTWVRLPQPSEAAKSAPAMPGEPS